MANRSPIAEANIVIAFRVGLPLRNLRWGSGNSPLMLRARPYGRFRSSSICRTLPFSAKSAMNLNCPRAGAGATALVSPLLHSLLLLFLHLIELLLLTIVQIRANLLYGVLVNLPHPLKTIPTGQSRIAP